ncbi:tetratricopeptide repeat protein [Rubrimonas cliftonensis]|uniref:Tetratricopeptide repeat-containing protein n=1 Tax=Rubrimonas cliftonensis TaxID=89524 RepID=A0A1H4EBJ1_9RHOB|nr:tetratricopeptide repeat protein [Rubrimonas cliftonensis]SEA82413.1 Tetratricopeptide repeat-containing protein [Rubrimonas cliftonensis]
MLDDEACREKLAIIAVGAAAAAFGATGVALPAGVGEAATGGAGLLSRLSGKRASDRDAVITRLSAELCDDWRSWAESETGAGEQARTGARTAFALVIDRLHPAPAEIVGRRLDAGALARAMLARAQTALPVAYADPDPRNAEAHLARSFLLHVCTRAYARLLANPDFTSRLAPDLWRGLFEAVDGLRETLDALPAAIRREVEAAVERLRGELGARDRLILGFIRTAAQREVAPDQIEATLFEMAVEWRAARGRADGGALSNLTPDLGPLRADAQAAHDADDVERFWILVTELERREAAALTALAARRRDIEAEEEAMTAAHVATKRRAIAAALSRLDASGAATRIAEIIALETPDASARFAALRARWDEWHMRGRDQGLNLDLAVAADLARIAHAQAVDADQRGAALNDLGVSLQTLGEREPGTERLEQAVQAHRAALEGRTRERVPLDWAMTQMNLGTALTTLGAREAGTERLEQAVEAYRAALEESTRERTPLDWAMTQMNLGTALRILGEREPGTERLEQAVEAYRAALEEWTRERTPLDWASTQINLGNALAALGEREPGTERLEQAVQAYRAALEERTRERVPLDWAKTQMNLGTALKTLGEREAGTERLEQAVEAYRAALEELARERVPLYWAMTQMNLGNALQALGARESGTERLEQAVEAYRAALEEYTRERVPLDWARTQMNLGIALWTLGEREPGTERLEQGVQAYRAALEEYTRERVPLDWARTQMNLGIALWTLGEREPGTERLEQAIKAYRAALEEWTRERVPLDWANARGNQAVAMVSLAERAGDAALAARAAAQLAEAAAALRAGGHGPWAATLERQLPAARDLAARLAAPLSPGATPG